MNRNRSNLMFLCAGYAAGCKFYLVAALLAAPAIIDVLLLIRDWYKSRRVTDE